MKADDIFILLLILVCVGVIAGLEIRSRRRQAPAGMEAPDGPTDVMTASTSSAEVTQSRDSRPRKKRKR
jgi:hypothetical protein